MPKQWLQTGSEFMYEKLERSGNSDEHLWKKDKTFWGEKMIRTYIYQGILTEQRKHLTWKCLPKACNPLFFCADIAPPQAKHCLLFIAAMQTQQSGLSLYIYNFSPDIIAMEQRMQRKHNGWKHIPSSSLIQSYIKDTMTKKWRKILRAKRA